MVGDDVATPRPVGNWSVLLSRKYKSAGAQPIHG